MSGRRTSTTAAVGRSTAMRSIAALPLAHGDRGPPLRLDQAGEQGEQLLVVVHEQDLRRHGADDTGRGAGGSTGRGRWQPGRTPCYRIGRFHTRRIRHALPPCLRPRPRRRAAPRRRRLRAEEVPGGGRPRSPAGCRTRSEDLVRSRRLDDRRGGDVRRLERQGVQARDRGAELEGRREGEAARPQDLRRPGQAGGGRDRGEPPRPRGQGDGAARRGGLEPLARDGADRRGEQGAR